jgi:hypothetical protein
MKVVWMVESRFMAIQEGCDVRLVGCHQEDSTMLFNAVVCWQDGP